MQRKLDPGTVEHRLAANNPVVQVSTGREELGTDVRNRADELSVALVRCA